MITFEEQKLMNRLAPAPKCMHDPNEIIDREYHIQCGECGMIAEKIIPLVINNMTSTEEVKNVKIFLFYYNLFRSFGNSHIRSSFKAIRMKLGFKTLLSKGW